MIKVLFTDFFGTLVSEGKNKEYISYSEEIKGVTSKLNDFLSRGNYLNIVSAPGGHGNFPKDDIERIIFFNSFLNSEFNSQVKYYIEKDTRMYNTPLKIVKIPNEERIYFNDSFYGISIDKKKDSINLFLNNKFDKFALYSLGDSEKDVPMLIEVLNNGGNSAIIDLYQEKTSFDVALNKILYMEYYEDIVECYHKDDNLAEEKRNLLNIKMESRKYEIINKINKGQIEVDEILRKTAIFELYISYIMSNFAEKNIFFDRNELNIFLKCGNYANFDEYYARVLKKD